MKRKIFIISIAMTVLCFRAYCVTTGVDFLKLGVGARETGMGEAAVAGYSGVTAACWNPAGLAEIKGTELGIMHSEAIMDASLDFIGAAIPLRSIGVVSVNTILYIIKPVPVTTGTGQNMGDLNWMDAALTLSFARRMAGNISCGIGAKMIRRIESNPIFGRSEGTAYALDLGLIYETPVKGLNAGYALLNAGNELQMSGETKKDTLPQTSRAGLSYQYRLDKETSLILEGGFQRILDNSWHLGAGAELSIKENVFLRTGFYDKDGGISGNTFGFGVRINQFKLDYSSIPASEMVGFNRNNKFSVTIYF